MRKLLIFILLVLPLAVFSQTIPVGFIAASNATATPSTLLNGIVAYYPMNETSGAVLDVVGSSNGTNSGAVANSTGKIGTGYNLDGTTDYIDMGNTASLSLVGAGTVALWIYPTSTQTQPVIISKVNFATDRNGYIIWAGSGSDYFRAYLASATANDAFSSTFAISQNSWQLIVLTWNDDADVMTLYKDNGAGQTNAYTLVPVTDVENFRIGDNANFGIAQPGYYDEVGVWNRALTADEVLELWNSGNGKTYPFN